MDAQQEKAAARREKLRAAGRKGGLARAAKLTAARRSEIAAQGFAALAAKILATEAGQAQAWQGQSCRYLAKRYLRGKGRLSGKRG